MHRAEQIIDAVVDALEASATLAAEVYKARTLSLSDADDEMPAVTVNVGSDDTVTDLGTDNVAFIDSLLEVRVSLYAQAETQPLLITELMRLRSKSHIALMADQTQGLSFVMSTRYGGADVPELATEGGTLAGRMDTTYRVLYRMRVTDPE